MGSLGDGITMQTTGRPGGSDAGIACFLPRPTPPPPHEGSDLWARPSGAVCSYGLSLCSVLFLVLVFV